MNGYSTMRAHTTPIPTPEPVRLGGSALIAAGVAALSLDLSHAIQLALMLIFIAAACLLIFSHPYRRDIRAFLDKRNLHYTPRLGQIIPLFLVWLTLMIIPAFAPLPLWGSILVFVGIFGWMWLVFPHVDGTRVLAFVD
ncbi:hypothetical protein ACUY3K_03655 [Corynebacterium uberis]|uniref:hypothetical protein n=1 Tax=Corynebacterium TaxID=1716 RepID=UPI001D0B8473|nr:MULTISPECIES: hypothetical protein [Corynebacterium]MCZ9309312.1 hypothetical protein [Corynebacterium sp. c6VSa_13]UDL72863.1 hypothetical protein LH391_07005 [Corynebacterium uberis]UDL76259.1 hypothetical protein LH393_02390 [Corynebacterium uberis]UDL78472.1 hypothetical protein LH394_02380 [Corynebacterium uberis]UDL80754.1 hypothetical protein LH392_02810 [Corynebacterium uberis]